MEILVQARISQGFTLNDVLFPLTLSEILDVIEKNGFEINPTIPYPYPKGRFAGSGELGRKGKTIFNINGGEKSIVIIGDTIEEGIETISSFIKGIKDTIKFDITKHISFYQLISQYKYYSNENSYEKIGTYCKSSNVESISKIMGEEIQHFGIRIGPIKQLPNSVDWFDLNITPDIEKNSGYNIDLVYRNPDKEKFDKFRDTVESNIIKIIKLIEK